MEEYLTVKELSARIKFSRQTLYNLIHKGTFILGKHYLKPTPKKVLFKWSAIKAWMNMSSYSPGSETDILTDVGGKPTQAVPKSLINI